MNEIKDCSYEKVAWQKDAFEYIESVSTYVDYVTLKKAKGVMGDYITVAWDMNHGRLYAHQKDLKYFYYSIISKIYGEKRPNYDSIYKIEKEEQSDFEMTVKHLSVYLTFESKKEQLEELYKLFLDEQDDELFILYKYGFAMKYFFSDEELSKFDFIIDKTEFGDFRYIGVKNNKGEEIPFKLFYRIDRYQTKGKTKITFKQFLYLLVYGGGSCNSLIVNPRSGKIIMVDSIGNAKLSKRKINFKKR